MGVTATEISEWHIYAAGIGAGNPLDHGCSRYGSAYPNRINVQLGKDTKDVDFTFIACSGAKIPAITDQAASLDGGQQMITISAGGNDAGLIDTLNNCVFTFKGFLSSNCDKTLDNIQTFIDGGNFASSMDGLITAAKSKLAPGGTMWVVIILLCAYLTGLTSHDWKILHRLCTIFGCNHKQLWRRFLAHLDQSFLETVSYLNSTAKDEWSGQRYEQQNSSSCAAGWGPSCFHWLWCICWSTRRPVLPTRRGWGQRQRCQPKCSLFLTRWKQRTRFSCQQMTILTTMSWNGEKIRP